MIVVLDIPTWRAMYPAYAALTDAQITMFFAQARMIVRNRESSPVPYNPPENSDREIILYLLTCHLAELTTRGAGSVGRVASAAEGSVNASMAMGSRNNARWYEQTQCGSTAWQLLLPYRTGGKYVVGC